MCCGGNLNSDEVYEGYANWDMDVEIMQICLLCTPQRAHTLRYQHELPLNIVRQ